MKAFCVLLGGAGLVLGGSAQQTVPAPSSLRPAKQLQAELRSLSRLAHEIADARTKEDKAQGWLTLNQEAKKFGEELNSPFPQTSITGDKISPAEAQRLAQAATSYGVRVDFCEPSGNWAGDNQGYFKYLELWPQGPKADEATWMGPLGNASSCGDSEGLAEELKQFIRMRREFLRKFPNSRFAAQAKQEIARAQAQLEQSLKSKKYSGVLLWISYRLLDRLPDSRPPGIQFAPG